MLDTELKTPAVLRGLTAVITALFALTLHVIFGPKPEGWILTLDQGAVVNYSSALSALHSH